jgi:hypothetical protein
MPDLGNRDALEKKLRKELNNTFSGFSDELIAELEKVDWNVNMLSPAVWNKLKQAEIAVFIPFFEIVALEAAAGMLEVTSIGVDWALVNQRAADWARSYSTFLAGQIDATSRDAVATSIRNSIASFFEDGMTQGQLAERLRSDPDLADLFTADVKDRMGRVYGPQRAATIARTETTRAAVQGEREFARELRAMGVKVVEVWQTRNDEIVCPICEPRHNKKRGDGWDSDQEPPGHPNCRCWINHELSEE